jgi:hypothetical protein
MSLVPLDLGSQAQRERPERATLCLIPCGRSARGHICLGRPVQPGLDRKEWWMTARRQPRLRRRRGRPAPLPVTQRPLTPSSVGGSSASSQHGSTLARPAGSSPHRLVLACGLLAVVLGTLGLPRLLTLPPPFFGPTCLGPEYDNDDPYAGEPRFARESAILANVKAAAPRGRAPRRQRTRPPSEAYGEDEEVDAPARRSGGSPPPPSVSKKGDRRSWITVQEVCLPLLLPSRSCPRSFQPRGQPVEGSHLQPGRLLLGRLAQQPLPPTFQAVTHLTRPSPFAAAPDVPATGIAARLPPIGLAFYGGGADSGRFGSHATADRG